MSHSQWRLLSIVVLAIVAGCATAPPSNIVPVGKDAYRLSMTGVGFATQANPMKALRTASEYCDNLGKHLSLQRNAESGVYGFGPRQSNLTFLCLDASDPDYKYGKMPTRLAVSP
jgi:hypothetical protein